MSGLIGRWRERDLLCNAAEQHQPVLVYGPSGIGTTSLVAHWAADNAPKYEHLIWLDLAGGTGPHLALRAALQALNADVPASPELRAAAWRQRMLDQSLLVVADEVTSPMVLRALAPPGSAGSTLVATSPTPMPGVVLNWSVSPVRVTRLAPGDARELARARVPSRSADLAPITAASTGRPLIIRLLAGVVSRGGAVPDMEPGDIRAATRAAVDGLPSDEVQMLAASTPRMAFSEAVALLGSHVALWALVEHGLIDVDPTGRVRVHGAVRAAAQEAAWGK